MFHTVHTFLFLPLTSDEERSFHFPAFEIHNPADLSRTDAVDESQVRLFVLSAFVQTSNILNRAYGHC